jgi:hypothetical protein
MLIRKWFISLGRHAFCFPFPCSTGPMIKVGNFDIDLHLEVTNFLFCSLAGNAGVVVFSAIIGPFFPSITPWRWIPAWHTPVNVNVREEWISCLPTVEKYQPLAACRLALRPRLFR